MIEVDRERYEARIDGRRVNLTTLQCDILSLLVSANGKLVTREDMVKTVWGWPKTIQLRIHTRTIDQNISRIRKILKSRKPVIRCIRGRGYCIVRN